MSQNISVVINTFNEEKNIARALDSVKWANEIIVCDMHSEDKTVEIAKKHGAGIFFYRREDYVEPARNFVLSKVSNDWILVLDADEQISDSLAKRLQEIANDVEQIDYVRLPRKNLIFGHFMQASMWWPDYNIRFFKKGKVKWGNQIHRPPEVVGQGLDLPAGEKYAIIHSNYGSISGFIKRMDRYSGVQAAELRKEGYQFNWKDLFEKPLGEFLSRFFAGQGYKDGLHGLALSLLQAFSFVVVYLKVWEMDKFPEQDINMGELTAQKDNSAKAINYWVNKVRHSGNIFEKVFKKIKR